MSNFESWQKILRDIKAARIALECCEIAAEQGEQEASWALPDLRQRLNNLQLGESTLRALAYQPETLKNGRPNLDRLPPPGTSD